MNIDRKGPEVVGLVIGASKLQKLLRAEIVFLGGGHLLRQTPYDIRLIKGEFTSPLYAPGTDQSRQ